MWHSLFNGTTRWTYLSNINDNNILFYAWFDWLQVDKFRSSNDIHRLRFFSQSHFTWQLCVYYRGSICIDWSSFECRFQIRRTYRLLARMWAHEISTVSSFSLTILPHLTFPAILELISQLLFLTRKFMFSVAKAKKVLLFNPLKSMIRLQTSGKKQVHLWSQNVIMLHCQCMTNFGRLAAQIPWLKLNQRVNWR